jgi:hypothetical protein
MPLSKDVRMPPGPGPGVSFPPSLRAAFCSEAAVFVLDLAYSGKTTDHAHLARVTGEHARRHRVDEFFKGFPAEVPGAELGQRLVRFFCPPRENLAHDAQPPADAQQFRGEELRRFFGQLVQFALAEHVALFRRDVGRHRVQAQVATQLERGRALVEKAVDPPLAEVTLGCLLGDHLAAGPGICFEHGQFRARVFPAYRVGRSEPGYSSANDSDFHGCDHSVL